MLINVFSIMHAANFWRMQEKSLQHDKAWIKLIFTRF